MIINLLFDNIYCPKFSNVYSYPAQKNSNFLRYETGAAMQLTHVVSWTRHTCY